MLIKLFKRKAVIILVVAFFMTSLSFSKTWLAYGQVKVGQNELISENQIHQQISQAIKKSFSAEKDQFAEIKPPRISPIRKTKTAQLAVNVVGEIRNYRVPIELILTDNQKVIRKQRVFVKIDYFSQAWSLKKDGEAGQTLTIKDLQKMKVASRKLSRDSIKNAQFAVGAKLKRSIKANKPLKKSMLNIPKLVKRGAIIELIFNKSGIFLSAEGEALGDGKRNDIIKVRNLKSKKIVTGRVVGVNQVDVGR